MKKLVLMIALFVGATTFAQERKMERREMSSENKVEKLTKELDLTTEQQAKAKEIFAKKAETKKAERAEAMEVRKADNDAFDREFRAILTPEQAKKYDAKKAEMKSEKAEKLEKRGEIIEKRKEKKLEKSK